MSRGGPRNRSGPPQDPASGRSERRGVSFTALPSGGYAGPVPRFPLPRRSVRSPATGKVDARETQRVERRELALWQWAWSTPQACAWAMPSESWRLHTIAMWVRTYVLCETSSATAADKGSLHRFADQIGMTPAGLKENGWAIASDEVSAKAAERSGRQTASDERPKRERRLRVAPDAQ